MKLWLPKWLRSESKPTDAELESADRRLFLRGLTLTSAGLVVGVPLISVPKPTSGMGWAGIDLARHPCDARAYLVVSVGNHVIDRVAWPITSGPSPVYGSIKEALAALPNLHRLTALDALRRSGVNVRDKTILANSENNSST